MSVSSPSVHCDRCWAPPAALPQGWGTNKFPYNIIPTIWVICGGERGDPERASIVHRCLYHAMGDHEDIGTAEVQTALAMAQRWKTGMMSFCVNDVAVFFPNGTPNPLAVMQTLHLAGLNKSVESFTKLAETIISEHAEVLASPFYNSDKKCAAYEKKSVFPLDKNMPRICGICLEACGRATGKAIPCAGKHQGQMSERVAKAHRLSGNIILDAEPIVTDMQHRTMTYAFFHAGKINNDFEKKTVNLHGYTIVDMAAMDAGLREMAEDAEWYPSVRRVWSEDRPDDTNSDKGDQAADNEAAAAAMVEDPIPLSQPGSVRSTYTIAVHEEEIIEEDDDEENFPSPPNSPLSPPSPPDSEQPPSPPGIASSSPVDKPPPNPPANDEIELNGSPLNDDVDDDFDAGQHPQTPMDMPPLSPQQPPSPPSPDIDDLLTPDESTQQETRQPDKLPEDNTARQHSVPSTNGVLSSVYREPVTISEATLYSRSVISDTRYQETARTASQLRKENAQLRKENTQLRKELEEAGDRMEKAKTESIAVTKGIVTKVTEDHEKKLAEAKTDFERRLKATTSTFEHAIKEAEKKTADECGEKAMEIFQKQKKLLEDAMGVIKQLKKRKRGGDSEQSKRSRSEPTPIVKITSQEEAYNMYKNKDLDKHIRKAAITALFQT